jgi:hypothetical protein
MAVGVVLQCCSAMFCNVGQVCMLRDGGLPYAWSLALEIQLKSHSSMSRFKMAQNLSHNYFSYPAGLRDSSMVASALRDLAWLKVARLFIAVMLVSELLHLV